MKVGSLVRDLGTREIGIILEVCPVWLDEETGVRHVWDFKILSDGNVFNVDGFEIESVNL